MKNCSMHSAYSTSHARAGNGLCPREERMRANFRCSGTQKAPEQHKMRRPGRVAERPDVRRV
jgi:hypothetical protein